MISCCGKYLECSSQKFCINEAHKSECSYAKKLEDGHNFYDNEHLNRLYILVDGKCYAVSRRNKVNLLYSLDEKNTKIVKGELDILGINYLDQYEFKSCFAEKTSDKKPAYWDISFSVGSDHYTIRNFNIRMMTHDLAKNVQVYLFEKGLKCSVSTTADSKMLHDIKIANYSSSMQESKLCSKKEIVKVMSNTDISTRAKVDSGNIEQSEIQKLRDVSAETQIDMFNLIY